VRETAAEQLEESQSDWAYSKPVIALDVMWNLAFVAIGLAVLGISFEEKPKVPLRVWVLGYLLQCLFHIGCTVFEYFKRRRIDEEERMSFMDFGSDSSDSEVYPVDQPSNEDDDTARSSVTKYLESGNTMFSFIWWIVGFYWVTAGGQTLTRSAPQLYWLCVTFLAFDVVFVLVCVAVAGLIGIAVCCCLPCIIAILYALTDRKGATKEEIDLLPKYKFHRKADIEKINSETQESVGGIMTECNTDTPVEHILSNGDAECCICLSAYDDGSELRELPCNHHFHCTCIDKWLFINATCPLCKFNILKTENQNGSEEV
jgi:hypothetical protein